MIWSIRKLYIATGHQWILVCFILFYFYSKKRALTFVIICSQRLSVLLLRLFMTAGQVESFTNPWNWFHVGPTLHCRQIAELSSLKPDLLVLWKVSWKNKHLIECVCDLLSRQQPSSHLWKLQRSHGWHHSACFYSGICQTSCQTVFTAVINLPKLLHLTAGSYYTAFSLAKISLAKIFIFYV